MARETIHLCMCADSNIIQYARVVIASAVYFTPADIHVHMVHPVEMKDVDILPSLFLAAGAKDIHMYPAKWSRAGYSGLKHVTETTMLRLLIPSLLTNVNRVLYMDIDTMVCSSILPIFNNTSTGPFGIALKTSIHKQWSIRNGMRAGNAGIMLWDLDIARAIKFQEQCMYILDRTPSLHDQDVINYVLKGQYGNLAPEANIFVNQDHMALDHYVIFHFAGKKKPWNEDGQKGLPQPAVALWQAFAYSVGLYGYPIIRSNGFSPIDNAANRELQRLAVTARSINCLN